MIEILKKIINEGLISLLKNNTLNTTDSKKISIESKLVLNNDPKKLKEKQIARERAREVQNQYKQNFSKIEATRAERRKLEDLEVKRKKLEEEKRLQEEAEEYRQNIFKRYEENPDGSLKIEDHNDFLRVIEVNQNAISEVDHKYIRDFVRISTLLECKAALIQKYFSTLKNPKNNDWIDLLKQTNRQLKSEIEIYKKTLAISLSMVSALISKDLIAFYKIYEQFDSNGLFNSHHENKVEESLSKINKSINQLENSISIKMDELDSSINNVALAIYEMGYMNGEKFDRLNNTIQFELRRVNSSTSYSRLIENLAPFAPAVGLVAGYKLGYSLTGPSKK